MSEDTNKELPAIPDVLPVFPVRDQVIFPHMIFPLLVGREGTLRAIEAAMMKDRQLLLLAQKDPTIDEVEIEDLFEVGIVAKVVQVLKLPNGLVKILVEGLVRARMIDHELTDGYLSANGHQFAFCLRKTHTQAPCRRWY